MRTFLIILVFSVQLAQAQTSLKEIDLPYGDFAVGFQHYTTSDSTRTYQRMMEYTTNFIPRPIPVSVWYPSEVKLDSSSALHILNYFEILKTEEEWEHLPNEQLLNWFYYANTPENNAHLNELTNARPSLPMATGTFPVVVYTPSFHASSVENFALCELLASHGFIVFSSTSRGSGIRWFNGSNAAKTETQARDVEFLIAEAIRLKGSDPNNIAVMGFSFGGIANGIAQARNSRIKGVVSLDGTERYQYNILAESPFFQPERMNVPYMHLAQKDIPPQVLEEDNIPAALNSLFPLYDSITKGAAYRLKFHHLTHSYFSSLGVLFEQRDSRQDKSDAEIMESYRWVSIYSLKFLEAYLKNNSASLKFIQQSPSENRVEKGLISWEMKMPDPKLFGIQEFNQAAGSRNYENLPQLYQALLEQHPELRLKEGDLNTLGLQLVFDPHAGQRGIRVLEFATTRYPNSANLFDSLAEAYLYLGDIDNAVKNFEQSLRLNPENQNAVNRLAALRK